MITSSNKYSRIILSNKKWRGVLQCVVFSSMGVNGTALAWFSSYLANRKQRIHLNGAISEKNVRDRTTVSKLKMNDDKTECMLIRTRQQLANVSFDKITVGKNSIPPSQIVKNLGILMDCNLMFHKQVNNLCKSSYYFLYNI